MILYILDGNAFPISVRFDMSSILLHKRFRWVLLEIEFPESIAFIQFFFTFKDFKLKFYSQIQFNARSMSDRLFLKGSEVRNNRVKNGSSKTVKFKWTSTENKVKSWMKVDDFRPFWSNSLPSTFMDRRLTTQNV